MRKDLTMFSRDAQSAPLNLSRAELERFDRDGWLGPYSLLTPDGVESLIHGYGEIVHVLSLKNLIRQAKQPDGFANRPWFKSLHAHVPAFCDAASHSAIVNRLSSILGQDIIAWGVSVRTRLPGQSHRWHVDVEHIRWHGASVFIGLKNVSKESCLKVISGSHRVEFAPQGLGILDDEAVLAATQRFEPSCELVSVDMKEGEFLIFHGKLWHGSNNKTERVRTAVIAQYSTPKAEVRIPLNWEEPIQWHSYRPPCILVKGRDRFGFNNLISAPTRQTRFLKETGDYVPSDGELEPGNEFAQKTEPRQFPD
jgi:hypothetical protein